MCTSRLHVVDGCERHCTGCKGQTVRTTPTRKVAPISLVDGKPEPANWKVATTLADTLADMSHQKRSRHLIANLGLSISDLENRMPRRQLCESSDVQEAMSAGPARVWPDFLNVVCRAATAAVAILCPNDTKRMMRAVASRVVGKLSSTVEKADNLVRSVAAKARHAVRGRVERRLFLAALCETFSRWDLRQLGRNVSIDVNEGQYNRAQEDAKTLNKGESIFIAKGVRERFERETVDKFIRFLLKAVARWKNVIYAE
jgi:hypothetical protein